MTTDTITATERETRYALMPIAGLEVRDPTPNFPDALTISGYAAVTEQETVLYDGRFFQMREIISRGAFLPALTRGGLDVHLTLGHDMNRAIARTGVDGIGRLELTEDDMGLRMWARVDASDPDVMALAPKMRAGIVDQASFMFTVKADHVDVEDRDGKEVETRRIDEIGELYDVTVCARGAYPQTSASIRSMFSTYLGRAGIQSAGLGEVAPSEPVDPQTGRVAPSEPVDEFIRQRDAEAYELRLRLARTRRMN